MAQLFFLQIEAVVVAAPPLSPPPPTHHLSPDLYSKETWGTQTKTHVQ